MPTTLLVDRLHTTLVEGAVASLVEAVPIPEGTTALAECLIKVEAVAAPEGAVGAAEVAQVVAEQAKVALGAVKVTQAKALPVPWASTPISRLRKPRQRIFSP
jgi:hypothetical protein